MNDIETQEDGIASEIVLSGREEILTSIEQIDNNNILQVLSKAAGIHADNEMQIDYLYRYVRGVQPILSRKKEIRPEINNKVVENHASEIAEFVSSYFLGEPVTYVRRGVRDKAGDDVTYLNECMYAEDKASQDKDLATWMAICGVAYRQIVPDLSVNPEEDDSPFEIDTLDPRYTFVVYHSGFGHKPLMGVRKIYRTLTDDNFDVTYACYTSDMYYEVRNNEIVKSKPHGLGDVPIIEYRLNMMRMGSFEPAVPMLNAINKIMSDRTNGLEQFVQSFLKFKNCDIEENTVDNLRRMGAIVIKSQQGQDSDVDIVSQELDQQQTQSLIDHLYNQVLSICGLPSTNRKGYSTSDNGIAVELRDGWQTAKTRAKDTEMLFKRSEKMLLKIALRIIRDKNADFDLRLHEVECKFTRRQHDNLMSKTQSLLQMLEAGLHPEVAIATCGLFNDPMDVYARSTEYLKKWDYQEPIPETEESHEHEESMIDGTNEQ